MSVFQIPLDVSLEYFPMINDLLRMGIIQIVTQLMFYFSNPLENPFWSPMFVQTLAFILIGVLAYWLVFRHVVSVVPTGNETPSSSAPSANIDDGDSGVNTDAVGLMRTSGDDTDED